MKTIAGSSEYTKDIDKLLECEKNIERNSY
jgi:hypothetical protein